jgi:cytochrome c5
MKTLLLTLLLIQLSGNSLKVYAAPQTPNPGQKTSKTAANSSNTPDPGEQRFKQNCGRCHNPPDSLSPREVKAVLRHMRVRAMLSAEDEQLILKYLAP